MELVSTKVNSFDLHSSGVIVAHIGDSITLSVAQDGSFNLHIVFINDDSKEGPKISGKLLDNNVLEISLINFKNLGGGSTEPIPVGYINHRNVFITFRVYSSFENDRTFIYNILLGEGVKEDGL